MNSSEKKLIINKDFNPFILSAVLSRYWFWPFVFVGIFLMLAFFYLRYTKAVYESSAIIQIEQQDQGKEILDVDNINEQSNISKEIELLKSEFLFEKAIERLNMNVSMFSKGKVLTEELYHLSSFNVVPYKLNDSTLCGVPINIFYKDGIVQLNYEHKGKLTNINGKINEDIITNDFHIVFKVFDLNRLIESCNENQLFFVFNEKNALTQRLLSQLFIAPVDIEAKSIQISYNSYNTLLCHDIVDAVIKSFFQYDEEIKKQSADNILRFINVQLDSLSNELKLSKDSLTRFQKVENIPDPESMGVDLNMNLNKLRDQLFTIDDELMTLNLVSSKLKAEPNRLEIYKLLPEMLGKSYESSLSKQIEDLHQILERKEELLFNVTPENNEIKAINQRIQSKIQAIRRSLGVIQDRLYANSKVLNEKINALDGKYFELPEKKMEYNRLKSLQDLNDKYYALLTEKKVQYSISNAGYAPSNRILSKPFIPQVPISPNKKLIYISFFFFGFLLGLTLIIFRYLTYNEISNLEDLKKLLPVNVNFLGGVPTTKKSMEFSQIVVHESSRSMIAESMRSIRSNMSFVNNNAKVIAISSSISGEGKTFVALNLAGIIAMGGKKTIIIDLDLRKPKVHLGFNVSNENGMSNLIVGLVGLSDCIHSSSLANLDFITAGPVPPNPSELILSTEFQQILEELKQRYDIVIIDNPPVGIVSDGIQILANSDIPIYIFKANYSKRVFADRVKELFEIQQIKSLNIILNGISSRKRRYGYGYGYGYSYGYGYGYGSSSGYYTDEEDQNGGIVKRTFKRILNLFRRK